jgi:hypothetical protein
MLNLCLTQRRNEKQNLAEWNSGKKQVEGLRGRVKPEDPDAIRFPSSFYPVKGLKDFGVSLVRVVHLSRRGA